MKPHSDTSKNTKAWAVSQHSDTSNAWAVSQNTDTSKYVMTHQDDVIRCIIMWEPTISATIRSANKSVHPLKTVITTTHPLGLHLSVYSVHPLETVITTTHPTGLRLSAYSVHPLGTEVTTTYHVSSWTAFQRTAACTG